MMGASIKPTAIPSMPKAAKTISIDVAYASSSQASICGTLTSNIERLRPNGSDIKPDRRLPIG